MHRCIRLAGKYKYSAVLNSISHTHVVDLTQQFECFDFFVDSA